MEKENGRVGFSPAGGSDAMSGAVAILVQRASVGVFRGSKVVFTMLGRNFVTILWCIWRGGW